MAKRFSKELAEWEEKHGPQDEELKQFLETFPDVEDRINEYSRIIKMDRKIENYLYKASIKEKLKDELGY